MRKSRACQHLGLAAPVHLARPHLPAAYENFGFALNRLKGWGNVPPLGLIRHTKSNKEGPIDGWKGSGVKAHARLTVGPTGNCRDRTVSGRTCRTLSDADQPFNAQSGPSKPVDQRHASSVVDQLQSTKTGALEAGSEKLKPSKVRSWPVRIKS